MTRSLTVRSGKEVVTEPRLRTGWGTRAVRVMAACTALISFMPGALAHQPHDVIYDLALSPSFAQDGIMFATLSEPAHSHLVRSDDGGQTWRQAVRGLDNRGNLTDIYIAQGYPTDPFVIVSSEEDGIFRSDDGGFVWYQVNDGLMTPNIAEVCGDYGPGGELVLLAAGADGGLYRSVDRGNNWEQIMPDQAHVTSLAFSPDFSESGHIAACYNERSIIYTEDYGQTWSQFSSNRSASTITDIEVVTDYNGKPLIYVATASHGVWRNVDGGRTFVNASDGLADGYIMDIELSPDFLNDHTLFAVTTDQAVFVSANGGKSWDLHKRGIRLTEQTDVHYNEIAVSPDFAADRTIFLGAFEGLFRSGNGGQTWVEIDTRSAQLISGFDLSPNFPADNLMIVSRYGGGMYVSHDAGASWTVSNHGISNPFVYTTNFSPTYVTDHTIMAIHLGVVAISTNEGQDWTINPISTEKTIFLTQVVPSQFFDTDRTILIGSRRDGVFLSVDGGKSFEQTLVRSVYIPWVALSPAYNTDLVAMASVRDEGVIISEDGGHHWTPRNNGLPTTGDIFLKGILNTDGSVTLLAGTEHGLYETKNYGLT